MLVWGFGGRREEGKGKKGTEEREQISLRDSSTVEEKGYRLTSFFYRHAHPCPPDTLALRAGEIGFYGHGTGGYWDWVLY